MKIAVKNGPGWTFPELLWLRRTRFFPAGPFFGPLSVAEVEEPLVVGEVEET